MILLPTLYPIEIEIKMPRLTIGGEEYEITAIGTLAQDDEVQPIPLLVVEREQS